MSTKNTTITSVGFKFDLSGDKETICDILNENGFCLTDFEKEYFETNVFAGIYYSTSCRGGLDADFKSQHEMRTWYDKKCRIVPLDPINVSTLYLNNNGTCLVAEMHTSGTSLYCFFVNKNKVATTCQKKQLHQQQFYQQIKLDTPIVLYPIPYIDER